MTASPQPSRNRHILLVIQRILLTLWVGGIWVTGYIVAPSLFQQLDDRQLAGQLAGEIFHIMGWLGLVCGIVLIIVHRLLDGQRWRMLVLLLMVVLVAISQFVLAPEIASLRDSVRGALDPSSDVYRHFAMFHALASGLFLLVSLLGLLLVAARAPAEVGGHDRRHRPDDGD